MQKTTTTSLLCLCLMALPVSARAQTAAPSVPAYPATSCIKPDQKPPPSPGYSLADGMNADSYNLKIRQFNKKAADFDACTAAYIDRTTAEIDRVRNQANDGLRHAADDANRQIRGIESEIRAAIDGTAADAPFATFPPAECAKPDDALMIPQPRKPGGKRAVSVARSALYDRQKHGFESCTRDYIAQAKSEIERLKANATLFIQQTTDASNARIAFLNKLVRQALDGANDAARETAKALAEQAGPAAPGAQSVTGQHLARQLDTPTGEGDPGAITCRAPQILPASRLPGPEICKRNREWARLFKDGSDISSDGMQVLDSEKRRTMNPVSCINRDLGCHNN